VSRWPTPTIRALIVCGAFITQIAIMGFCYYYTEPVQEQYENVISISDIEPLRELVIAGIATGICFVISALFLGIHKIDKRWVVAIHLLFLIIATGGTVWFSLLFNTNWSLTWLVAFAMAFGLEILVAQTLLWLIARAIYKE
jgi:hypothetical protein